jgi:XRE family aerobic/anaerobic benzoate catabolism transcriptional regulator
MHYVACVPESILSTVGEQVRALRDQAGWSRRELAEASGLSERFLADVESGSANASLLKLAAIARALETTPATLLAPDDGSVDTESLGRLLASLSPDQRDEALTLLRARFAPRRGGFVALLGLRGAGKSTVGPELSRELARPFVELDELVERAAGMSSAEIFAMHGEEYFRRLERDVLARHLAESAPTIIATGGGLVADASTYELLQRNSTTVWLKARPEDHWERVVAQGDTRPMADHPQAMAELERILAVREPLYARADHVVDTTGRTAAQVCDQIAAALT